MQKNIEWVSEVTRLCPTLCDPMDGSLPDSGIHGIFQARILEWAAISFSRGSSQPRDQTRVSCIADRRFTIWATREASTKVIQFSSVQLLSRVRLFVIPWIAAHQASLSTTNSRSSLRLASIESVMPLLWAYFNYLQYAYCKNCIHIILEVAI